LIKYEYKEIGIKHKHMTLDTQTLAGLKEKLIAEKARLEQELSQFATKTGEGEFETRYPDDIGDRSDENATEVEEYADKLGLEQNLETQLKDVVHALDKMEQGTYGVCEKTGQEIPYERLAVYPAARTVVGA
jgi:RNA polymerase-binding transcription factor DksA